MALSRVRVWIPGDILTAQDLNNEYNNILDNPISLISPTTGAIDFNLASHVNLTPGAITASSANTGDILTASTGGTAIWGQGTKTFSLSPGAATFSTALFPTLSRTTDSNWPTYTLHYHSSVMESAYWYVQLSSYISQVSTATLQISVVATSSNGTSVWQVNTRMVNSSSTWNTLGSTSVSSTFTMGTVGDLQIFSIPLTASSWTTPGVLQVRVDRTTSTAGMTTVSTGMYLHQAALKLITV
jgi:hypothetical protein